MRPFKRFLPLLVSVGLVLAIGGIGIGVSLDASHKAREVHSADREELTGTLAGLANQYLRFSLKEVAEFSGGRSWGLSPGDPGDRTALETFTSRSDLYAHGAALFTLDGRPLTVVAPGGELPPADDPGYRPMYEALRAGEPGLSSVMSAGEASVVAYAVPIVGPDGAPRAVLAAFSATASSPLQVYTEQLDYGPGAVNHVVDSRGGVVAAGDPSLLGSRVPGSPAVDALAEDRGGFDEFARDGQTMVAAYNPIGLGGWGVLIEQPAEAFYSAVDAGGSQAMAALLGVLAAAAAGIVVLGYARQRALRDAYQYKGQLLANTTHELKTPLTAIRGASVTLGTRWRDLPEGTVDELLGMIHRRCESLGKLVDRVLIGARLDAGHEIPVHPGPIDMHGLLQQTATEFSESCPRHNLIVDAPDGLRARVDPHAIDQILGMLVENALKYSPGGGRIRLAARPVDGCVALRVGDQGVGISPEDLDHIFEPYYRANREDNHGFGGVGLGLSIVRHLVEANGGDIGVRSMPGRGTAFTIVLPGAEGVFPPTDGIPDAEMASPV